MQKVRCYLYESEVRITCHIRKQSKRRCSKFTFVVATFWKGCKKVSGLDNACKPEKHQFNW